MKTVLIIVLAIYSCSCGPFYLPRAVSFPNGWSEREVPRYKTKAWESASSSDDEWKVSLGDNGVIARSPAKFQDSFTYKVRGGNFVGFDAGEFGGSLIFVPDDQSERQYKVMDGNIKGIFSLSGNLYLLEGLAHILIRRGSMYRLDDSGGTWRSRRVVDLGDAPEAFTVKSDSQLCIVTSSKLLIVTGENVSETIVENADWGSLYPNSILFQGEDIIIGMRGGIAKINLTTKKASWYVR